MKLSFHNSLRALFLSLAVLLSLPMLAEEVGGINYIINVKTNQATVIKKSSGYYSGEVVIPESVEYEGTAYSVTSIGNHAFWKCSGLTSVTIPNSVTSIGDRAFDACSGLTSVTIPNSVTSIGDRAFDGCSGLTSVTIPNSVTSIGDQAFSWCSDLKSVTIGNSVTSIGGAAFKGCHFAKENFVNNSSLSAEENNYWGAELHDYETEDGLLIDNTSVVLFRKNAEIVTIPNSVTSIGNSAFYGCSGLTSVTIPNSVTSIGDFAFRECSGLTSVTIPNSVTSIGEEAFSLCSGLKSVTIGNSVTSIGNLAFAYCSGLTSVTIPNSVTSIGLDAFYECSGLTSVHISDIAAWCNINFVSYGSNPLYYAHHLYLNGEEVKDLVIPNSVTSIGDYAFMFCSGLTSVTIGNSVKSIGDYAFYHCSGLTSVTIPNSVTSIGESAFDNCPELLDVYCYAENVPSTDSYAFSPSCTENATLHVPDASIDSYMATEPWSGFGKIVGLSGGEPEQPEVEKCATPVVSYADGKLSMACETEEAVFVTKIVALDHSTFYDAEVELSATYNIEVFATKANYENSDTVSVVLVWVENGEVNEETGVISVPAAPVLVQGNGGILTVSGVVQNTEVVVYTIDGIEVDRAVASDGTAMIYTVLQSGTIVVVKFGNKSVKVRI